jgi:hypothetical protein
MGSGTRTDRDELPPAAHARLAENEDRHRAIARALHEPPTPRPQITEKLEGLRARIAQFRASAIDLHVKLVDLESKDKGDSDVRALRAAMMASVVRIEGVVRALIDTPDPTAVVAPAPPPRFPDGTRIKP